ncbi:MAG: hypothetical protein JSV58_01760, partial [Candidatus Bathyarchaeota archaeon]
MMERRVIGLLLRAVLVLKGLVIDLNKQYVRSGFSVLIILTLLAPITFASPVKASQSLSFLEPLSSATPSSVSIFAESPPAEDWIFLADDPDEGLGTDLKSIWWQLHMEIMYFKIEHHRNWTTIDEINTGILIDADRNRDTGMPDEIYPFQDTGIGTDYLIIVGYEELGMWKWNPFLEGFDTKNPISLAYLDAPDNSSMFEVGVYLADVHMNGVIDCAVADVPSHWDWMPDVGHFTIQLLEVTIYTDKSLYTPSETMLLGLNVTNSGLILNVCFVILLESRDGSTWLVL